LPADRALAFSRLASEKLGSALIRCEERYPREGAHSVLLAVVDRDPELWRSKLAPLHDSLFGPGSSDPLSPTMLEVIDRATDEALKRLTDAGLVAPTIRATRGLFQGNGDADRAPAGLSEVERQKALDYREQAGRKLKMARLLTAGELAAEAREAQLQAVLLLSRALAVENRLPEPAGLNETILAPISFCWGEAVPAVREFVLSAASQPGPVAEMLQGLLDHREGQAQLIGS
jgi:hypothetical protein